MSKVPHRIYNPSDVKVTLTTDSGETHNIVGFSEPDDVDSGYEVTFKLTKAAMTRLIEAGVFNHVQAK